MVFDAAAAAADATADVIDLLANDVDMFGLNDADDFTDSGEYFTSVEIVAPTERADDVR
jgi:hypothetical protein